MQLVLLAVGRLKERYWREAQAEYAKRLSGTVQLDIHEVDDEPAPDSASDAQRLAVLDREASRLERYLRDRDGLVVLDIAGRVLSSEQWSDEYQRLMQSGFGRLVFIVGGSYGLHPRLLGRAHLRWSFGPATFPHQLARIMALEQIYRGIRIASGAPYHK
ncbi:23S rRNA (pseudouridine(1915)-N(3))-methyltransferase RlmH [Alicyclobacillus macrosporangiidus]|uniref:23S rRNA (pseudouridine(1915)-N(3))-methyltransferase RlmH n=1 Tax=Alicyclobacillus macrosporangiidus TaxID=392015 RepID=UPI0004976713|nr:23S rRNA (pseudouridine(1915)-N(3))-methyltransferase RlmH [Alicyclobacillus macrosporangiidus]MCL6597731.1 23S rRNA (pseudouridine(1915)-N(3))-methyltransferase RlmH [Alicyclobacillus macrosporangiidus]